VTPAALAVVAEKAVRFGADLRPGQAAWSALYDVDERLACQIQGTASDPYHDDTNLPRFWLAVTEAALDQDYEEETA